VLSLVEDAKGDRGGGGRVGLVGGGRIVLCGEGLVGLVGAIFRVEAFDGLSTRNRFMASECSCSVCRSGAW
jgi:hypothetical protein